MTRRCGRQYINRCVGLLFCCQDFHNADFSQHPEVPPEEWEAYWGQHGNAIALAVQELSGVGESSSEMPIQYGDGTFPKPEPE